MKKERKKSTFLFSATTPNMKDSIPRVATNRDICFIETPIVSQVNCKKINLKITETRIIIFRSNYHKVIKFLLGKKRIKGKGRELLNQPVPHPLQKKGILE